jgi:hypothetical protein
MRSSSLPAFRPRRVLAVAGLLSLGSGLLMLTVAAHPVEAATSAGQTGAAAASGGALAGHTRTPPKASKAQIKQFEAQIKHSAAVSKASTTVTGPHLWNPLGNGGKGAPFPNPSSVTVTQTTSLVNQMVQVSWANFTPSGPPGQLVYGASNSFYPVMVAECNNANPSTPTECYGATNAGVPGSGPNGPLNTVYAVTGPNGTGLADIEVETVVENNFLGCSQSHACSLVIVPAQGGNIFANPPVCTDHSQDTLGFGQATALGARDFGSDPNGYSCSWADKIVVPLTFARTANTCSFKNAVFAMAGSPMMARAMSSWVAALCVGSHGLQINADSTISEPTALTDLSSGQDDVALTTRPASAQGLSTGTKKYLYAPVAVTAVSVAYWFDNPVTGLPDGGIHLNQRLLLKLLTQSYAYENDGCPIVPPPPLGCDNSVDHDPTNLFTDPEFLALNPDFASQNGQAPKTGPPIDGYLEVPTVLLGQSDMTWTVTSWIDANTDAKNFLTGTFDPYGGHINTSYLNLQYPNNSFIGQDNYILMQHEYTPVFPLTSVAGDQVQNWPPATSVTKDQSTGNFPRLSPEIPGQRALIAVLDQGDAAAFRFPVAAIPNGAGRYVEPTTSHMLAALQGMTSGGQGTKQVNFASKNKKAYPLTMVVYAVVPTSGVSHTKAAAIARFLDFAVGQGQNPGVQPGQLPPGFAPLPAGMRAQTRKDAQAVLRQTGATAPSKTTNPNTGSNSSPAPNPTSSPGSVALPTIAPSAGTGSGISLVNAADARPASITRYILPALLILGGLAALAGSSSLIGSSSTPISARLRRIGQGSVALSRTARSRLGLRRSK